MNEFLLIKSSTHATYRMAKWRVTKNGELRESGELREKNGELRIATPTFRNSPLIFKFFKGELREVLTLHFCCLIRNGELLNKMKIRARHRIQVYCIYVLYCSVYF